MQGHASRLLVPVLMLLVPACTSSSLPTLPPSQPAPQAGDADIAQAPVEVVSMVPGTPTEIYALVARGAHRCWFGADGPLKPTHVFHAEAEPPAKGGTAEIVLHERDETLRDQRGARAFRISMSSSPAGVRVAVAILRIDQQLADVMARDVAAWAKGGTDCELRRQPSPAPITGGRDPRKKR